MRDAPPYASTGVRQGRNLAVESDRPSTQGTSQDDLSPPVGYEPASAVSQYRPQESVEAERRDRLPDRGILVIGRRAAGKTVFMARLYEALWKGQSLRDGKRVPPAEHGAPGTVGVSCRALDGATHEYLMGVVQELRRGRWPMATIGRSWFDLSIQHGSQRHRIAMLDYPGEAFRRAFMQTALDADATALRAAVLSASALIILIDPGVIPVDESGALEDTFGMLQAVSTIRGQEGGFRVPIALVFTKSDLHAPLLAANGGVRGFVQRYFRQLYRECRRVRIFTSAAVRTREVDGRLLPDASVEPGNVLEPLVYCLRRLEGLENSDGTSWGSAREGREARRDGSGTGISPRTWLVLLTILILLAFAATVFGTMAFVSLRATG